MVESKQPQGVSAPQALVAWVPAQFEKFERSLNGSASSPLHAIRRQAFDTFIKDGFPSAKLENWKYTDVAGMARQNFLLADRASGEVQKALSAKIGKALNQVRLVFVDGFFSEELSSLPAELPKGLFVSSLEKLHRAKNASDVASAFVKAAFERHLSRHAPYQDKAFLALNTAFVQDGVAILVQKGSQIAEPIELLFVRSENQATTVSCPRVFLQAEPNAQVTLIERYVGYSDGAYCTSSVTDLVLGKEANIDYYKLQEEGANALHVGHVEVLTSEKSVVRTHFFSLGGKLSRNEVSVALDGERIDCTLNGLTVLGSEQHVDNNTVIDHRKPHCESREAFKGVYSDRSAGVFSGTIIVQPQAQKTNAFQSNKSILLSDQATIDSKPQLKIWADDVKCTHGATVGQLDEDALFYLRSRGVPEKEARSMLVQAFASDILNGVQNLALKEFVAQKVSAKLVALYS